MHEAGAYVLDLSNTAAFAREIQRMARRACANLPRSSSGHIAARKRTVRPIDYMRYAEFAAVLDGLAIGPACRVLDIGSPQWFSLYLAERHHDAEFTYINIMPSEIEPFREIANALGLRNISYQLGDVRGLKAPTQSFDRAISISVLEHVGPQVGGDVAALRELARVLTCDGEILVTVPYKESPNVVYAGGPVYDRTPEEGNFFAREYDPRTFRALVNESPFEVRDSWLITERAGVFSVDFYEWGPGRERRLRRSLVTGRIALQAFGVSLDGPLARRYLVVSKEPVHRLVNIFARLGREAVGPAEA